jgi:hypothetical protein
MAEENNITQPGTYNPMENMSLPSENVETSNVELPNVGVPPPPSISPNISSQNLVKSEKYNYSDPYALDWDSVISQIDTQGIGPMVDPLAKMSIDMATELNHMAAIPASNVYDTYPGYASPNYNPAQTPTTAPDLNSNEGIQSFLRGTQQSVFNSGLDKDPGAGYQAPFIGGIKKFNADRYYTLPVYAELGYNPFVNNEAVYDRNATFSDYFSRWSGEFGSMWGSAFTSSYRTWDDVFSGRALAGDSEGAEAFTDAMRIAGSQDHEGGVFTSGFWNDLSLQFAYPLGIISNIVFEDLIIRGTISAISRNPAPSVAGVATSIPRKLSKLKKVKNYMHRLATNNTIYRGFNASRNFVKNLKNVDSAKKFFYAGGNALGNLLTPNTLYGIKNLNNAKNTVEGVNSMRKYLPLFGEFYKDIRMMNLALSESKLEGGIVEKEMIEEMYRDYKLRTGEEPSKEVYDRMTERAQQAAHADALINIPIIFLTNKLVLGPASRGLRSMGDNVARAMKTTGARVAYKKGAKDVFYDAGTGFRRFWSKGIKGSPKALGGAALYYIGANLGEGIQELAQEGTAVGVKNYYGGLYDMDMGTGLDLYKSTVRASERYADDLLKDSISKGFKSQMTKQGWRTFMSGFMMAAPMQVTQSVLFEGLPNLYQYTRDPKKYKEYKDKRNNFAKDRAKEASHAYENMGEYFDKLKLNLLEQKQYDKSMYMATVGGSALDFYDNRDMSWFRHIYTVTSMGKMHHFKDAVKDMLKLTDTELKQAYAKDSKGLTSSQIREKLNKRLENMTAFEKAYNENLGKDINPFDPEKYPDGSVAKNNEVAFHEAFEFFRMMKMFVGNTYQQAVVRRNQMYEGQLTDPVMSKVDKNDISVLTNKKALVDEIQLLSLDTKEEGTTPETKEIQKQKVTKLELLQNYYKIFYDPSNQTKTGGFDKRKKAKLKTAYLAYLKHQGKVNDAVIATDKVDKSLEAIIDHQWLGHRMGDFYKAIEVLENPQSLRDHAVRYKDIMMKQYERNKSGVEQLRKIKKYLKLKERQQFLTTLAQRGIYPDTDQTIVFLESAEDIIPRDYYSDEGNVNPIDNKGQWEIVENAINAYTNVQDTAEETQADEDAVKGEESTDPLDDLNIDVDNIDETKREVLIEESKELQDFYESDPPTKEIVEREYAIYEVAQKLSKQQKQSPEEYEQVGEGNRIIKTRYDLYKLYNEKLSAQDRAAKDFNTWLEEEITVNDQVADILQKNGITERNKVVVNKQVAPTIRKGLQRVEIDENLGIELVKKTSVEQTSGQEISFYQILRDKQNIAGQINGTLIDPASQMIVNVQENYSGKNAENNAKMAYRAVKAFVNAELKNISTYPFDGMTLSFGQIIKDANNTNWEILSTEEAIDKYNTLLVVPADKRFDPNMMDFHRKIKPGQFEKQGWSIPSFGNVRSSMVDQAPIRKLKIVEPIQLYPWLGKKVEEGMPLYEEGQKSSIDNAQDAIASLQRKLKSLSPARQQNLKLVVQKNTIITNEQIEPWDDKQGSIENPYLKKGNPKYDVTLVDGSGVPIAKLGGSTAVMLLDSDGKTLINPLTITNEQAKRLFYTTTKKGRRTIPVDDYVTKIRENYAKAILIEEMFEDILKASGKNVTTINLKDIPELDVKVSEGELTYDAPEVKESGVKFSDLDYNTVNGENYLVFDYRTTYDDSGRPKKSLSQVIHNFKNLKDRKLWAGKAQEQMKKEDGFNVTTKLGRYIGAVKFKNGVWTFIELKGARKQSKEVDQLINELLDRQKLTVKDNSDKKAKGYDSFNRAFNAEFSDKFFISGEQGDRIFIGLANDGLIRVALRNEKQKTAFEIYLEPEEISKHLKNNPDVNAAQGFIGLVNFKFNQTEAKRKHKSEKVKKSFTPIKFRLTKESFRNHIPDNPKIEDFMDVEAGALPEVRSNVRVNINWKDQDTINQIISEAQRPTKDVVNEDAPAETIDKGIALTKEDYAKIFDSDYKDVNREILKNIAYKAAVGEKLTPSEADLYDAFETEIIKIQQSDFFNVTTLEAAKQAGISNPLVEKYKQLKADYEARRTEWLRTTKAMLMGEHDDDKETVNRILYERLNTNEELKGLKEEITKIKKQLNGNNAFKITKDFDGRDVADWDKFTDYVNKNLPDFITIEDISNLRYNAINNGLTLGAFGMSLKKLSNGLDIAGTIYTGETTGFRYHEAGHAAFRMLLTEPKIKELLSASKKVVRSNMRSKKGYEIDKGVFVKSTDKALDYMRTQSSLYSEMTEKELTDRLYEEFIMDDFENFKKNPKSYKGPSGFKAFFQKILEWIMSLFGRYGQADLTRFYEAIDGGKFKGATVQNNRFTNAVQYGVSTVALKSIPLNEQVISIPVEKNGRKTTENRIVYTYLPAHKAKQATSTIANIYLKRLDKEIKTQRELLKRGDQVNPINKNAILNDAVNAFIEMHNPQRSFYISEKNGLPYEDIVVGLKERYAAFVEYRDEILNAVNEELELYDSRVDQENDDFYNILEQDVDIDQLTTEDWNATAQEKGGWYSLPKDVRVLIGTTNLESTDEFGNIVLDETLPVDKQEVVYTTPDVSSVYNGMLKATADLSSEREILQSLYRFSLNNTDTKAVVKKLFGIVGLDYSKDGPNLMDPKYTIPQITNGGYFLNIIKSFQQSRLDYMILQKNRNTGNVEIYAANHADDAADQQTKWNNHYNNLIKPNNFLVNLKDAQDVLDDIIDYMKMDNVEGLNEISVDLSTRVFDFTGIKLHPGYIEYSVVNALVKRTPEQETLLQTYRDIDPITIEGITYLRKSLTDGDNIFLNQQTEVGVDPQDDTEINRVVSDSSAGIRYRLSRWARNNAPFDETVGTSTMRDTEGNMIYSHQMQSYNITKINSLNSRDKYYDLFNDGFLENNFLLNDEKTKVLSDNKDFRIVRILGLNEKNMDLNEHGDLVANNSRDDNKGQGKQVKSFTATDIASIMINMYTANVNTKTGEVKEYETADGEVFTTSPINPRLAGDSNLLDLVNLPINKTVELNDKDEVVISDFVINTIFDRVVNEAVRVHKEIHEGTDDTIVGYNDSPEGRGYHLTQTGKYLIRERQPVVEEELTEEAPDVEDAAAELAKLEEDIKKSKLLVDEIEEALQEEGIDVEDMIVDRFNDEIVNQIRETLEIEYAQFYTRLENLNAIPNISRSIKNRLYVNGKPNNKVVDRSMRILNLKENNLEYNLKQIFFNDLLNTKGINDVLLGNQSLSLSNKAKTKRAKGGQGAGKNAATSIIDPSLGIVHEVDKISLLTFDDVKFKNKYSQDPEGDRTDAQMYMTPKAFRYLWYGLGNLQNPKFAELLDAIERGEEISGQKFFGNKEAGELGYKDVNAILNSKKFMYFDGKTYIKTSGFVLTPQLTSMQDVQGNVVAIPGMEHLHNLRVKLERWEKGQEGLFREEGIPRKRLAIAVPATASKMYKSNVMDPLDMFKDPAVSEFTADNFIEIGAEGMRLQLVNPGGKTEIVDPRQIKMLISSEQNDKTKVWSPKTNDFVSIKKIKDDYRKSTADRVTMKYLGLRSLMFTFDRVQKEIGDSMATGAMTVNLYTFLKYAQEALKSSGSSSQMLDLFDVDEFGDPKYELNNVLTSDKFQQFVLSFFNKQALGERQPGHAVANVSDAGVKKLKKVLKVDEVGNPIHWENVPWSQQKKWAKEGKEVKIARVEYDNIDNESFIGLKEGDYFLDRLRHNKIKWVKDGDKWIDSGTKTSEILIPPHFREFMQYIKVGDQIPEFIAKSLGIRIPSQDKHSALNIEFADFLPVFYSSSAMFPQELIEIAGWDFDIDKVYMQIKEWYYNRTNKKFVEYGTRKGEEAYYDYIRYQIREGEKKGSIMYMAMDQWKNRTGISRVERKLLVSSAEIEAAWDEMVSSLQWSKNRGIAINRREEFGEKFDERISKIAFANEWGYTYDDFTGRFKDQYEPLFLGKEWMTDAEIKKFLDSKFAEIFKGGLDILGMPILETEYIENKKKNKGQEPYVGALNNDILDQKYSLLGNDGITKPQDGRETPLGYEPAVPTPIEDLWTQISNDPQLKSIVNRVSTKGIDVDSMDGKTLVWETTKEADIGGIVLSNIVFNNLQEYGKELLEDFPTFNNKSYTTFADKYIIDPETNKAIETSADRKQFIISSFITVMTDNLNLDGLAGKLGLNRDATGVVASLAGLSVDPIIGTLMVNHPAIREIYTQSASEGTPVKTLLNDRIATLNAWVKNLNQQEAEDQKIEKQDETDIKILVDGVSVTKQLLKDQIERGYVEDKKETSKEDILKELSILNQFLIARNIKDTIFKMTGPATLTAGIGKNMLDVERKKQQAKELGLDLNDTEFNEGDFIIDVRDLYNGKKTIQGAYYRIFKDLTNNIIPELFLTETKSFKDINNILLKNLGFIDNLQRAQVKKDLLSYLNARAYMTALRKRNAIQSGSLSSSLIYDEIQGPRKINRTVEYLRSVADENNYFLNNYIYNKNTNNPNNMSGINQVVSNTWTKLNDDALTKVQNSIWDLYSKPETRDSLLTLIHYLIVKDGLQFKRDTFLHVIPPTLFHNVLSSMQNVHNMFKNNIVTDEAMKKVFGGTINDITNDFITGYLESYKNWYLLPKVYGIDARDAGNTIIIEDTLDIDKMRENENTNIYITADYKGSSIEGLRETKGINNLFTVPIKISKTKYFKDQYLENNKKNIDKAIKKIQDNRKGRDVVFPKTKDGTIYLGKDLRRIYKTGPKTYQYLKDSIEKAFGFNIASGRKIAGRVRGEGLMYIPAVGETKGRLIMDIKGGVVPFNTKDTENKVLKRILVDPAKVNKTKLREKEKANMRQIFNKYNKNTFPYIKESIPTSKGDKQIITTNAGYILRHDVEDTFGNVKRIYFKLKKVHTTPNVGNSKYLFDVNNQDALDQVTRAEWEETELLGSTSAFSTNLFGDRPTHSSIRERVNAKKEDLEFDINTDNIDEDAILDMFTQREKTKKIVSTEATSDGIVDVEYEDVSENAPADIDIGDDKGIMLEDIQTADLENTGEYPLIANWFGTVAETSRINVITDLNVADTVEALIEKFKQMQKAFPILTEQGFVEELNKKCKTK